MHKNVQIGIVAGIVGGFICLGGILLTDRSAQSDYEKSKQAFTTQSVHYSAGKVAQKRPSDSTAQYIGCPVNKEFLAGNTVRTRYIPKNFRVVESNSSVPVEDNGWYYVGNPEFAVRYMQAFVYDPLTENARLGCSYYELDNPPSVPSTTHIVIHKEIPENATCTAINSETYIGFVCE